MPSKKKIAVFFGGRSPEHDVSIITGLQALEALDSREYDSFPVYISPQGVWYTGDALRSRDSYMLSQQTKDTLMPVTLDMTGRGQGVLVPTRKKMFGSYDNITFDVALPAFHGLIGEDGPFQGLMESANIPYTGMRTKASAVYMDKVTTKYVLESTDVKVLPYLSVKRPQDSLWVDADTITASLKQSKITFPCIVKPAHLGSSIGVGKAENIEDIRNILSTLFQYDDTGIIEPFVENMAEYNIAVKGPMHDIALSAIERPKNKSDLLDFKQKYVSDNANKTGQKIPGTSSEGMLSLTRDINPDISNKMKSTIYDWAKTIYERLDGSGCPRLDFICNDKTGEIWFNELNPCPGSFGYFLWEAAETPVLFSDLLHDLIEEAVAQHRHMQLPTDPTPQDARLFPRRT